MFFCTFCSFLYVSVVGEEMMDTRENSGAKSITLINSL
jgi:hypothetical protein